MSTEIDRLVSTYTPLYDLSSLVECTSDRFKVRLQTITYPDTRKREEMKLVADQYDKIMNVLGIDKRAERF
jgi:hypothetical protein